MILNDWGVVLWRRDAGEYDRRVILLTENHGALPARFGGVNRSAGKLKALSEPLVWAEYRLFFSPRSGAARVVGGRVESSFPALRLDLALIIQALGMCEMALRLTHEASAGPEKYRLLCGALRALEAAPNRWIELSFGLKLLENAGYGLRELPVPPAERGLWRALHELPVEELSSLPWQEAAGRRFRQLVCDHVEVHAERALRTRGAFERLERYAAELRQEYKEKVPC